MNNNNENDERKSEIGVEANEKSELTEYTLEDGAYGLYLSINGYRVDVEIGSRFYSKQQADGRIESMEKRIKKINKHLEDENRRLKRAQWLERAERAKETQFKWAEYCHCDKLYFCNPFGVSTRKNPYRHISRVNIVEWDAFWEKIKNKCLSKAEEYK